MTYTRQRTTDLPAIAGTFETSKRGSVMVINAVYSVGLRDVVMLLSSIEKLMCKRLLAARFLYCVFVICLLMTPVCGADEEHIGRREKYEERVLFVGEYGSGINQLRQYVPEEDPERLHPPCMSVAPDGTVLIADQFNGFIKRFSVSGDVLQTIPVDTSLPSIGYLSVDADGYIHYLRENSWLVTHDSDGAYIGEVALAAGRPLSVYDMTFAEGEIYIRNWDRELMDYVGLRFNSSGNIEERHTVHPDLWVATAGKYFVQTDSVVDIRGIPRDGIRTADGEVFLKDVGGNSRFSDCLGVDKHDNLYLKEYRDQRWITVKYDRHGREVAKIRVREVYGPTGGYQLVWLDPDGAIYALVEIDDFYHWAVYKYSPIEESGE